MADRAMLGNDTGDTPAVDNRNNEVSLAASYYQLFRGRKQQQQQQPLSSSGMGLETGGEASAGFWEEDEWTPEETLEAERLLEASRERCSIRSNGLSGRHGVSLGRDDEHAWNKFYSSHQTNFFKDRHYLQKAFPEEFGSYSEDGDNDTVTVRARNRGCSGDRTSSEQDRKRKKRTLVEIGCGVGNALLPFLEDSNSCGENQEEEIQWTVHGLDLSKVAINWLRKDERFLEATKQGRAMAYVCDISALPAPGTCSDTNDEPLDPLTIAEECRGVAHVSTLLFCLSAIAPGPGMVQAVKNAAATLLPGTGVLVFRDYGRFDEAQMKLGTSRNKLLDDANFYRKHDGTKCYYFTLEDVRELFEQHAGLKVVELKYLRRKYRNKATNEVRRRVWVQGRFRQRSNSDA